MTAFLRVANIVLGLVNVSLFVFWLSLSRVDVLASRDVSLVYNFDYITFLITVLGTIVAFVGIGFGVLSIFGFQFIVERAERKADEAARVVATTYMEKLDHERRMGTGTTHPPGLVPTLSSVPTSTTAEQESV